MRDEHLSTANYAAVIADLRAKRDEIDRTIAMLERVAFGEQKQTAQHATNSYVATVPGRIHPAKTTEPKPASTKVASASVGIGDVCARIVREHAANGPLTTRAVTDLVLQSGFAIETANPVNNVWSALNQRAKVTKDVTRVGSAWTYVGKTEKDPNQTDGHLNGYARAAH